MRTRRSKPKDEVDFPPYSVHEQHAAEPGRQLLGTALSRHETFHAAVEDAKSRNEAREGRKFVVCSANLVQWPL
jgi:hypothetical protein